MHIRCASMSTDRDVIQDLDLRSQSLIWDLDYNLGEYYALGTRYVFQLFLKQNDYITLRKSTCGYWEIATSS